MNRLQFLKTIGVGIAAAVIAPKVLINGEPVPLEGKSIYHTDGVIPFIAKKGKEFAWHEEDYNFLPVEALRINDLIIDRDQRTWVCTGLVGLDGEEFNHIHLTAVEANPEPNYLEVERSSFEEYFFIIGSLFHEGIGGPR